MKVWDEISAACERDEIIEGTISARVKGGLSVTIRGGVKAFLPGSQVDLRPIRNLDQLIGKAFQFKVIKFNKKRGNIVLSRRVLLEKERDELKVNTLKTLQEGMVVQGKVRSITDYGIFIGIRDGVDGMVHKSDLSWSVRVVNPSDLFQKNDDVEAVILSINHDEKKVSLGIKQLFDDPWSRIANDYPPGKVVETKVLNSFEGGIYVSLEEGIEACIPSHEFNPELAEGKKVRRGEPLRAEVLSLDSNDKRITLTTRQGVVRAEPTEQPVRISGGEAPAAREPAARRGSTLGDLIKEKLGDQLGDLPSSKG